MWFRMERKINRNNYEAWLLDQSEGRLNPRETRLLREFLLQHSDLDPEESSTGGWHLEAPELTFGAKEHLKKSFPAAKDIPTRENFDMFSIARMEGDLTEGQEQAHEDLVAGDHRMKSEWENWQKARLQAVAIRFPGKAGLLKKDPAVQHGRQRTMVAWIGLVSAAAAAVAVLLVLRTGTPQLPDSLTGTRISQAESPETATEERSGAGIEAPSAEAAPPDISHPGSDDPTRTSKPASLSIRKHQDPPELTGKERNAVKAVPPDSVNQARTGRTGYRPVDFTMASLRMEDMAEAGAYDKISTLELPPMEARHDNLTLASLSQKGIRRASMDYLRDNEITLLDIASAGVNGFSRLTGAEVTFGIARDENGKLTVVRFRSDLLSVDAPIRQPE